jgi:hypothetical protein
LLQAFVAELVDRAVPAQDSAFVVRIVEERH